MQGKVSGEGSGWWAMAGWALLAVVAILFIIPISTDVPSAYAAVFGRSAVRGTFTPTSSECNRECTYYGSFDSSDGRIRFNTARMDEFLLSIHKGDRVAAVWPQGTNTRVYLAHGSRTWLEYSLILAAALGTLAWSIARIIEGGRARRPR